MRSFMLIAMLIGLVVTAWLVMRNVEEQASRGPGAAAVTPIDRAADARRTLEAADRIKEQRAEKASRE